MGRPTKKNLSGGAAVYVSRKQALKKIQLSLKDFRRLCILKGIYPVEPKRRQKIAGGNSTIKTYYHMKDVQFLMHEPIIRKFREHKVFVRRLRKAIHKNEKESARVIKSHWPRYKLDHIVKERYPTFIDAVRDIDDALSMCFLIARLPKGKVVTLDTILLCRRLTIEFMHYVIESRSLRKVFISIKGIYYQAEINGQTVTWIVPHNVGYQAPTEVDFKIMMTFTEFYTTMLGFVNYGLYRSINVIYPPKLAIENAQSNENHEVNEVSDYVAALNHSLKNTCNLDDITDAVPDEIPDFNDPKLEQLQKQQEAMKKFENLFKGLKFYLNREVPRESLVFIIRSFGGEVSWCSTICEGATFDENNETITHHIVDRPNIEKQFMNRYYVQPQWVFDCVNARALIPVQRYFAGVALPPHLSPFVEEKEGEYVPPEKKQLEKLREGTVIDEVEDFPLEEQNDSGAESESDVEEEKSEEEPSAEKKIAAVKVGKVELEDKALMAKKEAEEEKRLAVMMIPKKHKRLYNKIIFGQKRRAKEANALKTKREEYDKTVKKKRLSA